jgi:hypothetical protein
MYLGDTAIWDIVVSDASSVINLTGKNLYFTVKEDPKDVVPVFEKSEVDGITFTDAVNGAARITVAPLDTAALSNTEHILFYDVRLKDADNVYTVLSGLLFVKQVVKEF